MNMWVQIIIVSLLVLILGFLVLIYVQGLSSHAMTDNDIQTIPVDIKEFKFTPSEIQVKQGKVKFVVTNNGSVPHEFLFYESGEMTSPIVAMKNMASGQTRESDVIELREGTYEMGCHLPGHFEAGMKGKIVVGSTASQHVEKTMSYEEMDKAHEAGVKAFPAKTEGIGGQIIEPKIVDGVKVFELTAKQINWEVSPGKFVDSYAYNGQVPSPEIRVKHGDKVKIVLKNELPESTSIHFHGVDLPFSQDGVPFISQPPVHPGETFEYEFTIVDEPGTFMYHSHHNAEQQVDKGLFGTFIVEGEKNWDVEYTLVTGDGTHGFTLNGKGFPATAPIVVKKDQKVFVRILNDGQLLHPMHLHGFDFQVIAQDGKHVTPYTRDTLTVAPGERYDIIFTASKDGIWPFHCHVLSHVESDHGMHGMVTAVIVQE
ncbi:MAG: multicopper oxidase domain-containing protein [Nitrosarchaeum sp.]|nr:multicopper oxidase domain-containing protein [Nitrosarchaeum sp.]